MEEKDKNLQETPSLSWKDPPPVPPVAKKPRIRNPYGKKASSSLPPLSQKALYGLPSFPSQSTLDRSRFPPDNDDMNLADGTRNSSFSSISSSNVHSGNTAVAAQHDKPTGRENSAVTTTTESSSTTTAYAGPLSVSLPPWQRLPTQSLSFGSAEILSVAECLRHAHLYHEHGRSIRCTGILEQVVADHPHSTTPTTPATTWGSYIQVANSRLPCLCVALSDPLANFNKHNNNIDKYNSMAESTSKILHNNDTVDNDEDSKPPPLPSSSSSSSSTEALFWAVFITPEQTGIIHSTTVGSPVTVMGEVVPLEESCRPCMTASMSRQHQQQQPTQKWALRVRLCIPVASTTNLALQWKALLLRRRHLLSATLSLPSSDANVPPRAGCGPPPYHAE